MHADSLAGEPAGLISDCLVGERDFGSFERDFVGLTWKARQLGDAPLDEAAKDIEHALVRSRAHVFNETEFRRWLTDALYKLAVRT